MYYINNDCAPDIIRFMSVKTDGKKNCSYYNFLRSIGEEHLPVFSDRQIAFINYLSGLLPLARKHEYVIVKCLLDNVYDHSSISAVLEKEVTDYSIEQFEHALRYMSFISRESNNVSVDVELDDQFVEYLYDLLDYGLTRYGIDHGEDSDFTLWMNYRMDQVQLKLLKDPKHNQVGTYYYDDYAVIFASLKKDASVEERLNYKDKFLQPNVFQWESKTNLSASDLDKLNSSKFAFLFIRKVSAENGVVLPFTYVGKGRLTNCRKTEGGNGTYLFDIITENDLPDYLQYDFGLTDF